MIRTQDRTPEYYTKESRDFQIIGKLFDSAFNAPKTGADTILNISGTDNIDPRLVEYLSKTLGFNIRNSYPQNVLFNMLKSFKQMIANKGTKKAVENAVVSLLHSQNITSKYYIQWGVEGDSHNIILYLPKETKNVSILNDVFDYILPAGFTYTVALVGAPLETSSSIGLTTRSKVTVNAIDDFNTTKSNYISNDGIEYIIKDMSRIGEVTSDISDFISPVLNYDTTLSALNQAEIRKDPEHE